MKVLASYNIKGGVGKTAGAVNLAWLAADQGYRVLIWDLDPQGAASYYLKVKPRVKGGGKKLLKGKGDLDDHIKATDFANLDLLPSDFSYRHMDLDLEASKKSDRHLGRLLKSVKDDYDLVFLDCPPSVSLVSENVFHAADVILTPLIPTTLSLRTYAQLKVLGKEVGAEKTAIWPYFSLVDRRKSLHWQVMEELAKEESKMLPAAIPYASEVERMGIERAPLPLFANPRSLALTAYKALWAEIDARLFGPLLRPVRRR